MGDSRMKRRVFFTSLGWLALLASTTLSAAVVRGPYLQLQTDDSVTVRWRTDTATDSVVRYGALADNLNQSVTVAGSTIEHSVRVTGLAADQRYYYSVGDSIGALAGDATHHFRTAPQPGVPAATRIWVIGDSGTANGNAAAVRDAYVAWAGGNPADFWLMLGDNAYNSGTDSEYQAAVFDMYPEILRQLPLWSTLGNHDGYSADSGTETGPYYEIFDLPTAAEAGGLASGTEAYYSFNYANIHFICLDSYDSNRTVNGAMLQWLEADLMLNDQPWVVAFWHHPPYTKGSHDSDTEGALIDMRQNALPILEAWGVDLVMTGHSHSYERSYLLDGHYGASGTLDPVGNVLDPGDGRDTQGGDGAYLKPGIVAAEHAGAVYAVAGSSGKISGGALNHPAMFLSLNSLGSLVLDVSGNRLDAVFLDQTGAVQDEFTILKTPDEDPPLLTAATAEDATHVVVDFDEPLDSVEAANVANYTIAGLAISQAELLPGDRSVRLTTSTMQNGASYALSVSQVQDKALNVILPGSSIDFDYFDLMTRSFQDELAPDTSYGGTRDAYIREASSNTPHGLETSLQVDGDEPQGSGTDMDILLAWDIGSIPAGATVVAAEMELEVTNPSTGSYSCYALRRDWDESEVTWNQAAASSAWGAPGAAAGSDRDASVLCTVTAGIAGPLTVPLNAAGIAAVQAWVDDPAGNHGLVIGNPNTSDGADFHSRESTTKMARPRLNVTYSVAAPPSNTAPTADYTFDCSGLECGFTDASTDSDGSVQGWSWDFDHGGQSSTAQNLVHSFPAGGTYDVTLTVTDDDGAIDTVLYAVTVSEPSGAVDQFAEADLPSAGTVSGSYADTHADGGALQSITERESGGKKDRRHSYLSHTWRFTVAPGSAVTLFANAWSGGSTEGDAFLFAWSSDGSNFDDLFTVSSISDTNVQNAAIPASGTIYIRVTDTDQTTGNNALDTIFVDQLYIRTDSGGVPPPNQAPLASFTYSCSGLGCDFTDTSNDPDGSVVEWAWDFDGTGISTSQNPSHSFGSPGTYTVTLTVTDDDGSTGEASVSIDVAEISLAATGYKVRGTHTVDLSWSGAVGETVEILRDGSSLGATPNDAAETDITGNKGGGSYRYQICEIGRSRCSNEVGVGF